MRRTLGLLALVFSACGNGELLSTGSAASFDVVLITLDTTRADRLGVYGYEKAETPNLDRLAREGIRFADAVSPAPITLVAHASMLTGLDPDHHGVRHNGQYRLDPSRVTLAEVLRENGYQTAAIVSGFVLDARYGLDQGFDRYDDRTTPLSGQPFSGLGERNAEATTDAALEWLGGRDESKPYFLWVHYFDPHSEYKPPEEYASRFSASPYDGEIAYMDSQIGRLIAELEKTGNDLLVVVAGDHGESFGEHSEHGHSRFLYESTQRVPLLLWSPGALLTPQVVDGAAVGLVDIFPTVLELLGITDDSRTDGVSLRLAPKDRERTVYMETMAGYLESGWAPLFGLRRHEDKFIHAPKPEYYRLPDDPGERENLYPKSEDEDPVSTLSSRLSDRLARGPSAEAVASAAATPDPESLRQLQALGYLSGAGPATDSEGELPDPKDMLAIQRITMESRGLRKEGRLEEALSRAVQAFEQTPKDLGVLEELALVYIEMNRIEEAERALRAYSDLKANPNIYMLLATILAETGRRAEGEALMQEAMELEPDHGGLLITWGDFLAARGNYREAIEWYQKAKRVDPYRATELADRKIVELRQRLSG
ncbi:MAG TPA: sulfatase-like hydrolase/transferase [Vicinamibacteria bacterium]|nr:sulfatase-like hydrolase/transferase [Vicinamibacteria bacterium]